MKFINKLLIIIKNLHYEVLILFDIFVYRYTNFFLFIIKLLKKSYFLKRMIIFVIFISCY
jgi:hypothetical protein